MLECTILTGSILMVHLCSTIFELAENKLTINLLSREVPAYQHLSCIFVSRLKNQVTGTTAPCVTSIVGESLL